MAIPKLLPRPPYLCNTLLLLILVVVQSLSGAEPMPNSSRECAICHIRWVDALVRNDPREDLMEAVLERQAGSGDMCLSCHDGSVVDSRFKVWSTRHHTTDSAPSAAVSIPTDKSPLDAQGRMTCATCHTAHAVPDSSDIKTVIFLRQPNVDSALCLSCHPEHGSSKQNSIWATLGDQEAPVQLCEACHHTGGPGKVMETAHVGRIVGNDIENLPVSRDMRILCTTCHDIHENVQGSKLLRVPIADLCGACHEDKLGVRGSVHDPGISEWARKLGFVSKGSCIDCHPVHGPAGEGGIWGSIKSEDTSAQLCETCHRTESPGKAMETPHMEKTLAKNSENPPENLVLGDNGRILCTTCHDIHQKVQGQKLLRAPMRDSGLCLGCHSKFSGLLDTPHDLRISAPDEQNIRDEIAAESGPCGSCHLVHITSRASGVWARGSISRSDFGSELCTCCHRQGQCAEARIPQYVDHPEMALVNRINSQQPEHMPTFDSRGEQSRTGSISCLTCHDPHAAPLTPEAGRKTSPSHRHMFLRPAEHQGLCADCHGMDTLWRFLYYHKEHRNPYPERNVNPLSPRKE